MQDWTIRSQAPTGGVASAASAYGEGSETRWQWAGRRCAPQLKIESGPAERQPREERLEQSPELGEPARCCCWRVGGMTPLDRKLFVFKQFLIAVKSGAASHVDAARLVHPTGYQVRVSEGETIWNGES